MTLVGTHMKVWNTTLKVFIYKNIYNVIPIIITTSDNDSVKNNNNNKDNRDNNNTNNNSMNNSNTNNNDSSSNSNSCKIQLNKFSSCIHNNFGVPKSDYHQALSYWTED